MHFAAQRFLSKSLSLLLLVVLAGPVSAAVTGSWRSLGPDGGQVYDLVYAPGRPQTMYAATGESVFRSLDGGASWAYAGKGLTSGAASLAIDPADPATVYAAREGVSRSRDGGTTWSKLSGVDPGVLQIATPARGAGTIYAATLHGLYKSINFGGTWKILTRGLPNSYGSTRIVADPRDPNLLYAITLDGSSGDYGLYRTTDGGVSWKRADQGLPAHPGGQPESTNVPLVLTIDPRSPKLLYAGTSLGQVYRSRDRGATWRATGDPLPGVIFSLKVDPDHDNVVFAGTSGGLFRSEDSAGTWARVSQGLPTAGAFRALLLPPTRPRTLYAGVATLSTSLRDGVFASTDGGNSWTLRSKGIFGLGITSIAVAPEALWVTANEILFESADRGQTWRRVRVDPAASLVSVVAVDPADASRVYAALVSGALWRSLDGGRSWEAAGDPGVFPFRLVLDPRSSSTLYAAGAGGIAKSADGGTTWTELAGGYFYDLVIAPSSPSTLYATGSSGPQAGVMRSTDGGATWTLIEAGLPGLSGDIPKTLAVDPEAADTLYTVADRKVFRTTDGGATWSAVGDDFPNRELQPLFFSVNPASLYLGVWADNVYKLEGGDSWAPLGRFPVSFPEFTVLAADPRDPCRIYAGGQGLFAFTESGTAACR